MHFLPSTTYSVAWVSYWLSRLYRRVQQIFYYTLDIKYFCGQKVFLRAKANLFLPAQSILPAKTKTTSFCQSSFKCGNMFFHQMAKTSKPSLLTLNHFRMVQGHCKACHKTCGLTDSDLCDCWEMLRTPNTALSSTVFFNRVFEALSWQNRADTNVMQWLNQMHSSTQ